MTFYPLARRAALMGGVALIALPALAQDPDDATYRTAPILVHIVVDGSPDDDANSVVAEELWVGGKVATSVLDTPASVSVITEKEIEARGAQTTEEVLSYAAGIHTDYYGTDDRNDYFTIRGFQATTYRDGLTLGSMRGVREEPLAYERVEVLRGANSALFGAADPGGSVNFVTRTPRFDRIAETTLGFDSHGGSDLSFDYGDKLAGSDTLAFRFTGKVQDSALDYDTSNDDETFLMGGLTWAPTDATKLSLVLDYLKRDGTPNSGGYPMDQTYDRSEFFGEPGYNFHNVERTSLSALLAHDFGGGLSLQANLRYSDLTDDFGYVYLNDTATRTGTVVNRSYFGTDGTAEEVIGNAILKYDASFGAVDSSTLGGVEFRDATTTSVGYFGAATAINLAAPAYSGVPATLSTYQNNQMDYQTKSAFLTQNFSFNDRIIATLGLRQDWMDVTSTNRLTSAATSGDFSETSGRAALTYKVTDQISAYASYVESVAPPTIGVDPERGQQFEIGAKYAPEGMKALFSIAAYDLTKKDVTIAVVQADSSIVREKIGESRVRGLDVEARAEVNEALSLIGAYSYTKSEVVTGTLRTGASIAGKEFTAVPNHMASIWANYKVAGEGARGDLTLGAGLRYVGSYWFDVANTKQSEAALLVDASIAYDINDTAALELGITNLMDEQHVVGSGTANYYNPGREFSVKLRKTW